RRPPARLNAAAGEPETVARLARLRDNALALFRELSGGAGPDVVGRGDARELAAQAPAAPPHRRRDRRLVRGSPRGRRGRWKAARLRQRWVPARVRAGGAPGGGA